MAKCGIDTGNSSKLLSPCPRMIDDFFENQLRYSPGKSSAEKPFLAKYVKQLNPKDNPLKPELAGLSCFSVIVVDLTNGRVVDHYFYTKSSKKGVEARTYEELQHDPNIAPRFVEPVFKWHANLVTVAREYLNGGWLHRFGVLKEITAMESHYRYIKEFGYRDLLNSSKPEELR